MKKTFTLSLALVAAASAYAVAPQQVAPVALDSHKQMLLQSVETVQPAVKMSNTLAPAALTKGATTKAIPSDATGLTHYYSTPAGGYYAQNSFTMNGGTYMYPIMLLPAYANNVWENWSYYFDASGSANLATGDFSYVWNYWDYDFAEASSTAEDLEVMNQPYLIKGMMMDAPALTVDADTVYQYTGGVIYGGKGHIPQYFIDGTGITDVEEIGLRPFDLFSDDIYGIYRTGGTFGLGANEDGSGWDAYANYGYTNFTVNGMAQVFDKPAVPYALSSLTVYAKVECAAGAAVNVTLLKINDEGKLTSEVIAEKTYKFTEAYSSSSTGQYCPVTVNFTTEDEYGFELDYQLIDCAMVMVISGYENNSLIEEFDLPVVFCIDETPSAMIEGRFYAFASYESTEGTYSGIFGFPYSFYTDQTYTETMSPVSLNMCMDIEYPYLQIFQDLVAGTVVEKASSYDLNLEAGGYAIYAAYCAGSAADIVISEYPEWLQVEVTDQTVDVNGMTGDYIEVGFAVDSEATNVGESCTVELSYKGSTQTFNITHAAAGVAKVATDNAEVVGVEYYNIQGQKLNAAPENGIFIQKSVMSDGSIKNVKVVK